MLAGLRTSEFQNLISLVPPSFNSGGLHVSDYFKFDQDCFEKLHTLVSGNLRWRRFSITRWCGVGPSARLFMRSLAVGVDDIWTDCRDDPDVGMYLLSGFKDADFNVRRYMAVAAVGSYPSESLLAALLEDDRLLLHAPQYWQILEDELEYIEGLPEYCWLRLVKLLKGPPDYTHLSLKSDTLLMAHVSIAYIYNDIFYQLTKPPLNITQGPLRQNLEELLKKPLREIRNYWHLQIRNSLDLGTSIEHCEKGT